MVILWSGKAKVRDRSLSYEARFFNVAWPQLREPKGRSAQLKAHLVAYEISVHRV